MLPLGIMGELTFRVGKRDFTQEIQVNQIVAQMVSVMGLDCHLDSIWILQLLTDRSHVCKRKKAAKWKVLGGFASCRWQNLSLKPSFDPRPSNREPNLLWLNR